jgi:hypothetical protein
MQRQHECVRECWAFRCALDLKQTAATSHALGKFAHAGKTQTPQLGKLSQDEHELNDAGWLRWVEPWRSTYSKPTHMNTTGF